MPVTAGIGRGRAPRDLRRRAVAAAALGLALAAGGACRREAAEAWTLPEVAPPALAADRTPTAPAGGRLALARRAAPGARRAYAVQVGHEARVRGPGHPALALSLRESFRVAEAEEAGPDGTARVAWTVPEAEVAAEPAREDTADRMAADLSAVSLRRPLSPAGTGAGPAAGGAAAEVSEALARLLAPLPGREVAPGDEWPLDASTARPLPDGGEARVERTGTARFEGMVEEGGRSLARITGRWDARPAGRAQAGGRSGEVREGRGEGRAAWLVDPATGATVRAEAAEALLLALEILQDGQGQSLELASRLESSLRTEEAAP